MDCSHCDNSYGRGFEEGHEKGVEDATEDLYDRGWDDGYDHGYVKGRDEGEMDYARLNLLDMVEHISKFINNSPHYLELFKQYCKDHNLF